MHGSDSGLGPIRPDGTQEISQSEHEISESHLEQVILEQNPAMKIKDGKTYTVNQTTDHTIPNKGNANSVTQSIDSDGKITKERYYDDEGKAKIDVDYTDHGNPVLHPKVPHEHVWDWSDPKNPKRSNKDD